MVKLLLSYTCQNCGASYKKWQGKCDSCGEWNSLSEESAGGGIFSGTAPAKSVAHSKSKTPPIEFVALDGEDEDPPRLKLGIDEFDRVLGGGLVGGSVILIGGDPGIGKSTLLTQATALVAKLGGEAVYISGEEAVSQVRMRARRLGLSDAKVRLAAETNLNVILKSLSHPPKPHVVVLDSIQTLWSEVIDAAPGTVSQVRGVVQDLVRFAKNQNITILLVGHVTKEGQIAGPRVVEHMVDTVLYFEGERTHNYRILRAVKNRFGPVDEIGVFEMTGEGLKGVTNPSSLFIGDRHYQSTGNAVFACIEGTRPLLIEIQALIASQSYGSPRRSVVGWDQNRLSMILAVLESRAGLQFGQSDVFLNVVGGLKITEPAADCAVALALISAVLSRTVPHDLVVFGEVSLSGSIRPVHQTEQRMKESLKLGFKRVGCPVGTQKSATGIEPIFFKDVQSIVHFVRNEL